MADDDKVTMTMDVELTDKEALYLGKVVALWGAIEHTAFYQTLRTYEDEVPEALPKALRNNLQFTDVLALWKARVVDVAEGDRHATLEKQYERIDELQDMRNQLIHGMWATSHTDVGEMVVKRVRKGEIISAKFDGELLSKTYLRLGEILYHMHTAGDIAQRWEGGGYISRRAVALLSGHDVTNDWMHPLELMVKAKDE